MSLAFLWETSCAVFPRPSLLPRLARLLTQLLLMMGVFSLLRGAFLAWNWELYKLESSGNILHAFLVGLRFDGAILCLLWSPLIIGAILPFQDSFFQSKPYVWFSTWWLRLSTILLILPNISDMEHFHFIEQRATKVLFTNAQAFLALTVPVLTEYWYLVLAAFLFCATVIRWCNKIGNSTIGNSLPPVSGFFSWLGHALVVLGMTVIVVRGGVHSHRPLSPVYAVLYTASPRLAILSLNSAYTLLRMPKARTIEPREFFPSDEAVREALIARQKEGLHLTAPRWENVMIFAMESMGTEFLGTPNHQESRIPFVESLAEKGALFFENNFSNGGETGYVFDSVLGSCPETSGGYLDGSAYGNNTRIGIGTILKKHGYNTFFFHGGPKGLFWFDVRGWRMGFEQQFTLDEYENKSDFDGEWGVYDEPYFQYTAEQLKDVKEPFAAFVLSVSNHPPFRLPAGYTPPDRPDWNKKEHTAYYADQALEKFFAKISHYPWFHKTLFVITGDHPPFTAVERYAQSPLRLRVPLIFYHPGGRLPDQGRSFRITQHADVVPSVLDFLGLSEKERNFQTPYGRSVFAKDNPGVALLWHFGMYKLVSGTRFTTLKGDDTVTHYDMDPGFFRLNPTLPGLSDGEREMMIKEFAQFSAYSLIQNRLYGIQK